MALKKSQLYSSLWSSCDELRGGMDASQYKDYVLVLLFIKYVSDKYAGQPYAPIIIPPGASFSDMVALKGKPDIGDQINKKIIAPLGSANKLSDLPDFNDANKLGTGKEMVERLTNLIAIFENPGLDFSKNRADGDDILGDAYEYLMRHFATESGKSKGQFYLRMAEGVEPLAEVGGPAVARAAHQYGVPPEIIVAIWGLESDYGKGDIGKMPVVRTLATMAHDCRRTELFQGELLAALKIVQRGDLPLRDLIGAFAGEIGQTQFLPSSYIKYGVDFDGNGHVDLRHSIPDVLASTANLLHVSGFRNGQPYGEGTANFEAMREWNRATIYRKTIAYFADQLSGQ